MSNKVSFLHASFFFKPKIMATKTPPLKIKLTKTYLEKKINNKSYTPMLAALKCVPRKEINNKSYTPMLAALKCFKTLIALANIGQDTKSYFNIYIA